MTSTTPTHVDTSIPELWAKLTLRKQLIDSFWSRFAVEEGRAGVMIRRTELLGQAGDQIHIQVTDALAGAAVSGDTATLEGNEENLSTSEINCKPLLYRHGVRRFRRAAKKSLLDLREESKFRLAEWGSAKMDAVRWSQFVSANEADVVDATYTPNYYVVGGGTTKADVEVGDILTVAAIKRIRYHLLDNLAAPLMVDGLPRFFFTITPEMEMSLKDDTDYQNYVLSAASRGMDNPLFTGAVANIDGVVILTHPNVPTAADAGAGVNVPYAKALAFGKEAFVEAVDEEVTWVEKTFDYDFELGVAYSFSFQPRRGLERNSLQVLCSNPAVTG